MKKIIIILLVIFVVIFGYSKIGRLLGKKSGTMHYVLNGKTYNLLTAKTSSEWQQGLMFYKELKNIDGMIFIFPDKQTRSFWNKNTFFDLNVYWLENDKVVGSGYLPAIENKTLTIIYSPKPVNKVIELKVQK